MTFLDSNIFVYFADKRDARKLPLLAALQKPTFMRIPTNSIRP